MILQPVGDNIILKIAIKQKEEVTSSGIVTVNSGTQQSLRTDIGEVIAVGTGRTLNNGQVLPLTANINDKVLYNKYAGTEIDSEDGKYLILKETDILAIIK